MENAEQIETSLEIERQRRLSYQDKFTAQLLPKTLKGETFLDIGCGVGTGVFDIVSERGGDYLGADIDESVIRARPLDSGQTLVGKIGMLPIADKTMDYCHTRLVLMNLPEPERVIALKEVSRVGRRNIIIDMDWTTFKPVNELTDIFISLAHKFMKDTGRDPYHGSKLNSLVQETLGLGSEAVQEIIYNEGGVTAYNELAGLANVIAGYYDKMHDVSSAKVLRRIVSTIHEGTDEQIRTPFVRPNLVAVKF